MESIDVSEHKWIYISKHEKHLSKHEKHLSEHEKHLSDLNTPKCTGNLSQL